MSGYALNPWNPWRELDRLQNEVGRLFGNGPAPWQHEALPVNVWVGDDGAVLTAKLPGVKASDLDISVLGETLTLRGQRAPVTLKEGQAFHRQERTHGAFVRTVQLPFRVDSEKVLAQYTNGVLELKLPRSETDKPRRITIKS